MQQEINVLHCMALYPRLNAGAQTASISAKETRLFYFEDVMF
jgi:hypothetical protein